VKPAYSSESLRASIFVLGGQGRPADLAEEIVVSRKLACPDTARAGPRDWCLVWLPGTHASRVL
jgi:hypothetical protein